MIGIRKRPRQRARAVDWEAIANGGWWTMVPGVDHDQDARGALKAARTWGLDFGLRVEAKLPAVDKPFGTPWQLRFYPAGHA